MKRKMKSDIMRKACGLFTALLMTLLQCGSRAETVTLAIYMLGSDLEAGLSAATEDIYEILLSTKQTPVTVRARLGGSRSWWLTGLEEGGSYDIEIQNGRMTVLHSLGDMNCATGEALKDFLESCPGDTLDLIIWGHGTVDGIGFDALHGNDILTLEEIQYAIQNSGSNLRLLGLDACSMATIEVFSLLAPCAELIAACSEEETIHGWPYREVLQWTELEDDDLLVDRIRQTRLRTVRGQVSSLTVFSGAEILSHTDSIQLILAEYRRSDPDISFSEWIENIRDSKEAEELRELLNGQGVLLND